MPFPLRAGEPVPIQVAVDVDGVDAGTYTVVVKLSFVASDGEDLPTPCRATISVPDVRLP